MYHNGEEVAQTQHCRQCSYVRISAVIFSQLRHLGPRVKSEALFLRISPTVNRRLAKLVLYNIADLIRYSFNAVVATLILTLPQC